MSTPAIRQPRQSVSSPVAATKSFTLADIVSKSKPQPNRYALQAGVGFGKTSFAAYFPSPVVLMTRGETGLQKLIESGQIPETPHFPEMETWADLLDAIRLLDEGEHQYKTLVLDTANGAERMMHEHVCERDFNGDWTERGFMGYMRGYDVSLADWRLFLNKLDGLRIRKSMTVLFLMHSRIKTFKNPSGADYDKYTPEMHEKTWSLTKGWLDCILFGNFEVTVADARGVVRDASKKGKAAESAARILYTNSDNPIFEAKNRMGLPDEIELGASAKEGFRNFSEALKATRKPAEKEATNGQ